MSKPFDAAAKVLFEADPVGWAAFLGVVRPPGGLEVIDADLSSVSLAADKVLRVGDDPPWLLHVEFQSDWDSRLPRRFLAYNAILADKYGLPVATVVVLLAPPSRTAGLTGRYVSAPPFGPPTDFGYTVVRVWEASADRLLTGPLALVPLAPVAADPGPDVLPRAFDRVRAEADLVGAENLMAALSFLLQLRYGTVHTADLIRQFPEAREFGAFRVFLEEGRAEGRAEQARALLLRQGRKKFGDPTAEQEVAVNAVADLARLEALSDRLLDVTTWDDLLRPG